MRKIKQKLFVPIVLIALLSIYLQSCKFSEFDEESINDEFFEFQDENLSDSMWIKGSFAVPLVNTKIKITALLPSFGDELWIEADASGKLHLRSHFTDKLVKNANTIYGGIFPQNSGYNLVAQQMAFTSDSCKLKIFQDSLSNHVFFDNPIITLTFKNELPFFTKINLDSINLLILGGTIGNNAALVSGLHTILAPTLIGNTATTKIVIDKSVIPTLPEVFRPIPKFMSFSVKLGNFTDATLAYNIIGNEKISMDVDLDLPTDAYLQNYVVGDTVKFTALSDNADQNQQIIKSIELRLELDNGCPFNGNASVSFTDSLGNFIQKVNFVNNSVTQDFWFFNQAPFNLTTQKVDGSIVTRTSLVLDQATVQNLIDKKCYYLIYNLNLNTNSSVTNQLIKFYDDNFLGLKIGIKLDYYGNIFDVIGGN